MYNQASSTSASTMQKTCTNKLYQHKCINYAQHNLYQQPVSSISSTKSDLFTKINHQDNSQPYAQYHQDVHQPRLLTNINKMYHNQDVLLKVYPCIYATSSISHMPIILLPSASNNVPSMYQSCINYRSSYDSSRCTNITIPCTNHVHQPCHTIHIS
jgi:hypothetical protein